MPERSSSAPPTTPALKAEGLSKRFGRFAALSEVDFELAAGEVHAIVGENGAGKSTLVKILAGQIDADTGSVTLPGQKQITLDVAMVHQELTIVPHLSVLDNLMLGHPAVPWVYRRRKFRKLAKEQLELVGLAGCDLDTPAEHLSLAERQLLEIARITARESKVLILDEPTATLTDTEIDRIFSAVRKLVSEGRSVVFITHRFREIFDLCDRVTTMRNGRTIATHTIAETTQTQLIHEMLGKAGTQDRKLIHDASSAGFGDVLLQVEKLGLEEAFADVSFEARQGEIVGLVGQLGSGADELARVLGGLRSGFQGRVVLNDQELRLGTPRCALSEGVSYVSDDRAGHGIFLHLPGRVNVTSANLRGVSRRGIIDRRLERKDSERLARLFQLAEGRLEFPVSILSGGNQQKISLAKSIAVNPKILVLNEPTRGVDIGARTEIYGHLRAMAASGVTIVLYTSDLSEAIDVCDTILTVYRGRVVRRTNAHTADQSTLLQDILHPVDLVA